MNLTSRIQSYTTGGQILVSEAVKREVGPIVKIGKQTEVRAKGFEQPIALYEVVGIGGPHKLSLVQAKETLTTLIDELSVSYYVADGSHLNANMFSGRLSRLSSRQADLRADTPITVFSNLEVLLTGSDGKRVPGSLFCKVVEVLSDNETLVHFTSMSPEIETFFKSLLGKSNEKAAIILPRTESAEPAAEPPVLH